MARQKYETVEIENEDGTVTEIEIPQAWEICDSCSGHGKSSRYLERDGGGWTMSEFMEDFPEAEDRELYFSGGYDRTCEDCCGSGKILVPDLDALDDDVRERVIRDMEADAAYARECEWERRMLGC